MPDRASVTITEAAAMLGVRREKIARLVKGGILTARPSTIDARRRLIPRSEIERILREEGYNPPATRRRHADAVVPRETTPGSHDVRADSAPLSVVEEDSYFWSDAPTIDELAQEQSVAPVRSLDDLAGEFWPDDETADEFVAAVRQWRSEG